MLTGTAMQLYNRLCFRDAPDGLYYITKKMEARFGDKFIFENAFNQFIKMKQGEDEEVNGQNTNDGRKSESRTKFQKY